MLRADGCMRPAADTSGDYQALLEDLMDPRTDVWVRHIKDAMAGLGTGACAWPGAAALLRAARSAAVAQTTPASCR
jgi:hypothetical protein